MKYAYLLLGMLFFSPLYADTLYQADVGGYSGPTGVSLGFGVTSAGAPYAFQNSANYYGYSGYTAATTATGIPYDNFTYPYSSGCCGCLRCNNCDTGYANRCR